MNIGKILGKINPTEERLFRLLYEKHYPQCYRIALSIVKNRELAQDVVQDTFIKVLDSLHQIRDMEKFDSWLAVVATSKAIDILRKRRNMVFMGDTETIMPYVSEQGAEYKTPDILAEDNELKKELFEIIQRLKPAYRGVVYMRYYCDMTYGQIAQLLGIKEGTVKSRINRALGLIRRKLSNKRTYHNVPKLVQKRVGGQDA
ncbi:MAG: RNA polymerase sigma factor [Bacillota bacterium]